MPELVESTPEVTLTPPPAPPAEGSEPVQAPAGSAPATPEGDKPAETAPSPEELSAKQDKVRARKQLDRAYRREAEAKARADFFEKQYKEFQQKAAPVIEGEPKLEQFDDIEKYAIAKAEFRSKKAIEEFTANQRNAQAQASQSALASTWEEKASRGDSKYEDFDEVVGEIKPTNVLTMAIMKAGNGEDIAYHLGKHLNQASTIAALDPIGQILAIGELSAKLLAAPPRAKAPSNAPAPISPVSGRTSVVSETLTGNEDYKTFLKIRNKQLGRK